MQKGEDMPKWNAFLEKTLGEGYIQNTSYKKPKKGGADGTAQQGKPAKRQ